MPGYDIIAMQICVLCMKSTNGKADIDEDEATSIDDNGGWWVQCRVRR